VWITRKGAIRAGRSDMGVIPGSMGASSFVVRGKGNEASYQSSSHGAGRRLGRKAAIRQLTTESLRTAMAGRAWDDTLAEQLVDDVALAQGWLTGADMPRMADPVVTNTRLICHALPPGVPFNALVGSSKSGWSVESFTTSWSPGRGKRDDTAPMVSNIITAPTDSV
jgi:hypothetical protein